MKKIHHLSYFINSEKAFDIAYQAVWRTRVTYELVLDWLIIESLWLSGRAS